MTKKKNEIAVAAELIRDIFERESGEIVLATTDERELLKKLDQLISHLLNRDLQKLLLILYRIDVDEEKVKKVLSMEEPDKISVTLAELILERQKEKLKWRQKYRDASS